MRMESAGFGPAELRGFMDELYELERDRLADRLQAVRHRTAELGARLPEPPAEGDQGDWNAGEVMAHIAVASRFYSYLLHRIGGGQMTELDLVSMIGLRDVQGSELARRPAAEVVAQALADQDRGLSYLRVITPEELRRQCVMGTGLTMSASDIARLPLVIHLEQHLDQLEAALAG